MTEIVQDFIKENGLVGVKHLYEGSKLIVHFIGFYRILELKIPVE